MGKPGEDNTGSWLNSPVFIEAWNIILDSKKWINSEFVVKADPDAVFFPDRLGKYLASKTQVLHSESWFSMNCKFYNNLAMFGALEVFSVESIRELGVKRAACNSTLPWFSEGWGEDRYMQECMKQVIKARHFNMEPQIKDNACGGAKNHKIKYSCDSADAVSFHPYKTLDTFRRCYHESLGSAVSSGMPLSEPSQAWSNSQSSGGVGKGVATLSQYFLMIACAFILVAVIVAVKVRRNRTSQAQAQALLNEESHEQLMAEDAI